MWQHEAMLQKHDTCDFSKDYRIVISTPYLCHDEPAQLNMESITATGSKG